MLTIEEIVREVRTLPVEERKRLIGLIVDTLTDQPFPLQTRNLLEFEGVGAEIWQGIDAQEYVKQLRSEWDDRP